MPVPVPNVNAICVRILLVGAPVLPLFALVQVRMLVLLLLSMVLVLVRMQASRLLIQISIVNVTLLPVPTKRNPVLELQLVLVGQEVAVGGVSPGHLQRVRRLRSRFRFGLMKHRYHRYWHHERPRQVLARTRGVSRHPQQPCPHHPRPHWHQQR